MSSVLQTPEVSQLLGQNNVHRNLSPPQLVEAALRRNEAELARVARLVAGTGKRTGRSPKDKFTVKDSITETSRVGPGQPAVSGGKVRRLIRPRARVPARQRALRAGPVLRRRSAVSAADPGHQRICLAQPVCASNCSFARPRKNLKTHKPEFTIVSAPGFLADPKRDGTNSEVFVIVNFTQEAGAHRRHPICRRNEEVDLRHHELPAAAAQCFPYALLG